jgi:predicted glycosyltransferase
MHQKIISKFDECWVPDHKDWPNLADELSHPDNTNLNLKYIGPISRFDQRINPVKAMTEQKKYDVMILLSGPEPQRTILEEKLLNEIKSSDKKVLFVRGILSENQQKDEGEKLTIINYLLTDELQKAIVNSKVVLARSGYTTIMDLNSLQAKAFFIPTPGQFEQEYLAKVLENQKLAPYARQNDFKLEMLDKVNNYQGFGQKKTSNRKDINFPFDAFIR